MDWKSAEAASWVQAIGAIIGMVITLALYRGQIIFSRKQAHGQHTQNTVQVFDAVGACANFANERFWEVERAFDESLSFAEMQARHSLDNLQVVLTTFSSLPLHQLPDHHSVNSALELRMRMKLVMDSIQAFIEAYSDEEDEIAAAKESFRINLASYRRQITEFESEAKEFEKRPIA